MNKSYCLAPEVETIGRKLIREHHTHLISHGVHVEFLFAYKTPKKGGKEIWGTARKISSLTAFLASVESEDDDAGEDFFAIVISQPVWQYLPHAHRIALVDHELMHLGAEEDEETGDSKIYIIPHDFEGFNAEIRRHGMWREDAKLLFAAMQEAADGDQGKLQFDGPEYGTSNGITTRVEVLHH